MKIYFLGKYLSIEFVYFYQPSIRKRNWNNIQIMIFVNTEFITEFSMLRTDVIDWLYVV